MHHDNLIGRSIHSGDVVDWEFLSNKGLAQSFFDSINTDPFSRPQWVNLFQINEPVFCELVCEFFASFEFDSSPYRYDPLHKGVTFRLGGVEKEMSLLELGWRESKDQACSSMPYNDRHGKETTHHLQGRDCLQHFLLARQIPKERKGKGREPPLHVYKKTSSVKMGVIMELHEGVCCWPATREVTGEGEGAMRKVIEKGEMKELGALRTSTAI
ncbi:hypothetical protein Tco_0554401 [Tanacetum coccineum]